MDSISLQILTSDLLGEGKDAIKSCLYYHYLYEQRSWIRRQIETIEFESERTAKRSLAMDIDYSIVNQIRLRYDQAGRICYLPCIKFFAKTPTLNASASSTGSHHITISRRHENSILGAAILVGRLLHGISEYDIDFNEARLWVPKLLDWLVDSMKRHEFESNVDPTRLQLAIAFQLPAEIHEKIIAQPDSNLLSNLAQSYIRSLRTFPLFVTIPCCAGRNHYSIVLYIAAMLFGLNAVFHTFIQIVRIGYFRADAFEEARMRLAENYHELIDDELAKIDETEPDSNKRIKSKKRVIRRAKWATFDAAIFNGENRTYILQDVHSEILPRWALKLYPTTRRILLLELLFLLALVKATAITYPLVVQLLGIAGKALWPIVRQVLSWLSLI